MTIYVTGDTHGKVVERLSYRHAPQLRELGENDFVFILGDFGAIWEKEQSANERFILRWLASKPWTTIAITGNHENYDRIFELPIVEKWNGKLRGTGYDNVWVAADPTIIDIDERHILIMPGADSHDIFKINGPEDDVYHLGTGYVNLVDPNTDVDGMKRHRLWRDGIFYRVVGESWWPQEAINIDDSLDLLEGHADDYFDFVFTHDAPSGVNKWFSAGFGRMVDTEGERFFDMVAKLYDYGHWYHGHYHFDSNWPRDGFVSYANKMTGVYYDMLKVKE